MNAAPETDPQPPPSGRGPGIVLLAPAAASGTAARVAALAADGYVVQAVSDLDDASLERALYRLQTHPAFRGQLAALASGAACAAALRLAAGGSLAALVLYDGDIDMPALRNVSCPLLWNIAVGPAGPATHLLAELKSVCAAQPDRVQTYFYADLPPGFSEPNSPAWRPFQAGIAYSRALGLLRRQLGPHFNLSDLWDRHLECEFVLKDATANMKTMVAQPYVNHVPTMTGGVGHDLLKRFYSHHFIPQTPTSRLTIPISRTVGPDRVIEEKLFCFTHDIEMDWMLPGIKPTGRYVEIPLVVVVTFRGDKLYNEHIYWDQASVLAQLGLIDPAGLPISGVEQARKMLDPALPSNTLMQRWSESEREPT